MTGRDEFTANTIRTIGAQCGWLCAKPDCQAATIGAKQGADGILNLGEAAHIAAAAAGGARFDRNMTPAARRHHSNGIWLCRVHARAVDADVTSFPPETLRAWQAAAHARSFRMAVDHVSPFAPSGPGSESDESVDASIVRSLAGARADIDAFMSTRKWPAHAIELTLRLRKAIDSEPFDATGLAMAIMRFNEIAVVAPPGMGKSTTLIQVANSLIVQAKCVPVLVPLSEWSRQSQSLWELAVAKRRFVAAGATRSDFDLLAARGQLALLLDGWNELDVASQARLHAELEALQRELPGLIIVLSTRRQALDVPLQSPVLVDIELLSDRQQLDIARGLRGDDGEALLEQARRTSGVRELVSIPLYLSALLTHVVGDAFPQTKEEALRMFVREHERSLANLTALRQQLSGRQDDYLSGLAIEATAKSNTTLTEERARSLVTEVTAWLRAAGQIQSAPEPMVVIDGLVAYHSLIRVAGEPPGLTFQHQQIQEWYVSFEVERVMRESTESGHAATDRLRREMLDDPEWEEPVLFAVERASRDGEAGAAAVAAAIAVTMEIDPMLAGEMIYRSDPVVWNRIAVGVLEYCRRWRQDVSANRLTGFMIRTGRPEFAGEIWKLISNPNPQVYLPAVRSAPRMRASVLGPDFATNLSGLPGEERAHILSAIAERGDYAALELVTKLTLTDADHGIRESVIGALAFRGADRFVAMILKSSDEKIWQQIALRGYPSESDDPDIDRRLKAGLEASRNAETDPFKRMHALIDQRERSPEDTADFRRLLFEAPFAYPDSNTDHLIHEAFQRLPDAVSGALVDRLSARKPLPFRSSRYLQAAPVEFENGITADAVLNPAEDQKFATNAANVVGPGTIAKLIDEILVLDAKWRADKSGLGSGDRDRTFAAGDLVACTRLRAFVRSLLSRDQDSDPDVIRRLADLFARHGVDDASRAERLLPDLESGMIDLVRRWADALLGAEIFVRSAAADTARAIARLKAPELLTPLARLLAEDLTQRNRSRQAASVPGPGQTEASNDAMMAYTNVYRSALSAIRTGETAEVLIGYLPNAEFGFEAAVGLKEIWDRQNGVAAHVLKPWPDFSVVQTRRAERLAGAAPAVEAPFATAILEVVDALTKDDASADKHGLAIMIARIGVGMPHVERAGLVDRLLGLPGHWSAKRLLLATLAMDGTVVRSDMILAGIRDFLEQLKTKSWMLPQNSFELEGWFELFAFSDRPATALEALSLLPGGYAAPHHLRRLITALGHSPSDEAEAVLAELANSDARFRTTWEWLDALVQRGTASATTYLLDQVSSGAVKLGSHSQWDFARCIATMMQRDPSTRADVYRRYEQASGVVQQLIEQAIADATDVEGLSLIVRVAAAGGRNFQHTNLYKALRHLMTEERPSSFMKGAQELHPVPVPEFRKALFDMTLGDGPVAALSRRTLAEIDVLRDDYGWGGGDRRHPDIASGKPWPIAFTEAS